MAYLPSYDVCLNKNHVGIQGPPAANEEIQSSEKPGQNLLSGSFVTRVEQNKPDPVIYRVEAKFNYDKAEEFHKKLTDGTIASQRPDGQEIVNSMKRAVIDKGGKIRWSEQCYCPTPLQHERKTVYDHYFTDLKTEIIPRHEDIEGESFIEKISYS